MINKSVVLFVLAVVFSGSAFALSCPIKIKKIDKALANSPEISAAQTTQVKELRNLGKKQHKSGQHGDSVDTLREAMKILGIG